MRIAYLDCSTGIAGDMTVAALIDAGVEERILQNAVASLKLPGVKLVIEPVMKGGFRALHARVEHPEQHAHRHLSDVHKILDEAEALTASQRDLARRIFGAVAEAEASVHGMPIEKVHFHEVGAIDSIVDIVAAAVGFDVLAADHIVCSPVPTGRGQIKIDHGICTVPAPGTAEILKGVPLWDIPVEAELTTPTGAAIVTTMVDRFSPALPEMTIEEIGYGAGTRDFPQRANLLRLFVGTAAVSPEADQVCLLETNLDDVSAEVVGYAQRKLFDAGALDVFSTPIHMKKNRPGIVLSVIARPADAERMEQILFDETATFGIRRRLMERSKRARREHTVETVWGGVRGKLGWRRGEQTVFVPEFEDVARVAEEQGRPFREVYRAAEAAFQPPPPEAAGNAGLDAHADAHHHHDHDGHSHDHDHDHHG